MSDDRFEAITLDDMTGSDGIMNVLIAREVLKGMKG